MKIVLDTNIYIAAALYKGLAKDTLEFTLDNSSIVLVVSKEILQELSHKLSMKFHWSEEKINVYLKDIKTMAEIVQTSTKISVITRDPKDNKILECALSGNADLIVTLDQDLIKLKNLEA